MTTPSERRAAAPQFEEMSNEGLLVAYASAMHQLAELDQGEGPLAKHARTIQRELLRRLNATDAASAAGSEPGRVVLDFDIAEQIRACLSYYVSLRRDDAHLLLGHLDSALIAAESAETRRERLS